MSSVKTKGGTELSILSLQGKDYLPVAQRILWFREERPEWSIETGFMATSPQEAVAKATIKDEKGRVIATAHKTETKAGFADFYEKAETGAIGRALALCGYGTQFTNDLEEGQRLADAPLNRAPAVSPHASISQPVNIPSVTVHCELCGEVLRISKSGLGYYCPAFKDTSKGEHTRLKASELGDFAKSQTMAKEQPDIPF